MFVQFSVSCSFCNNVLKYKQTNKRTNGRENGHANAYVQLSQFNEKIEAGRKERRKEGIIIIIIITLLSCQTVVAEGKSPLY